MKKFRLRDYLPVLIMVLCAAIFGVTFKIAES